MRLQRRLLIGAALGAGAAWGLNAWLKSRRRIDLTGKVVVITGSTSGLGFLLAQQAASRGARVVLNGRNADELQRATADLERVGAVQAVGLIADVAEPDQARDLIEQTLEHFGRIDVLINNAGTILVGPAEAMTEEDFQRVMATNFWGAFHPTQAALPSMIAQQAGRIVNISSIGGKAAMPHLLPYTASKYALTGWTEGLRAEMVRHGVYVTGVYPTTIRTGGHTHAWFKGDTQAEYSWFALGDTVPLLSASADKAAARILDAAAAGEPEVHIGWQVRLATLSKALAPNLFAEMMALVDRALPAPTNLDAPAVRGENLAGTVPDVVNRLLPAGTRPS